VAQQAYAPFLRRVLERVPGLRHVVWGFEAVLLALLWGGFARLSPDHASVLGAALLRAVGPHLRKHRHVRRNLAIALPDRTPGEIEALARGVWGSLGAAIAEFPHLGRIRREAAQRLDVVVAGEVVGLHERGRPIVFVTGHFGNWELATVAATHHGLPVTVVYSPDSNPYLARMIERRREALGCSFVSREGGTRALLRALGAGTSVGLVVDTRIDEGEPLPFFGREASTTTVPARLGLRAGAEIVPVRVERLGGARFRVTLDAPLRPDDPTADPREQARSVTRQLNACFERWIRDRPEQWECLKRRWPKERRKVSSPSPA
jgi:KDO2-lipid IV(A) lauroyltransferase